MDWMEGKAREGVRVMRMRFARCTRDPEMRMRWDETVLILDVSVVERFTSSLTTRENRTFASSAERVRPSSAVDGGGLNEMQI